MREPLSVRRALLETKVLPKLAEPVRHATSFEVPLATLVESVKAQDLVLLPGFSEWREPASAVEALRVRYPGALKPVYRGVDGGFVVFVIAPPAGTR